MHAKVEATKIIAAAQMKKAALLEDQNMLILMTILDIKIRTPKAREYLKLRRVEKLLKLRHRLGEEEERKVAAESKCNKMATLKTQGQ